MREPCEASRWSTTGPVATFPAAPAVPRKRVGRDLLTIAAGAAAMAGLAVAASRGGESHQGVALQRDAHAGSTTDAAGLTPADGFWESATPFSGIGMGSTTSAPAEMPGVPLIARTPEEHIAMTQALAHVMMPRLQDGQVTGFTIRDGALPPLFARTGVRAGDIVLSVNDRDLDGNQAVSALSRTLSGARRAAMVVERGGTRKTLGVALPG